MGAVCQTCLQRRLLDAPEIPTLRREVCNHRVTVCMGRVFYFTVDPRIMKREYLSEWATYMTDRNFDVWLTLYFIRKVELNGEKALPDNLIKFIALYL